MARLCSIRIWWRPTTITLTLWMERCALISKVTYRRLHLLLKETELFKLMQRSTSLTLKSLIMRIEEVNGIVNQWLKVSLALLCNLLKRMEKVVSFLKTLHTHKLGKTLKWCPRQLRQDLVPAQLETVMHSKDWALNNRIKTWRRSLASDKILSIERNRLYILKAETDEKTL